MARKIVITSGKGGVGKTTVAANLGMNLSLLGARVALVDVDFGLNNLDVVMGIENKVVYDINDVLEGRCRVKQALVQDNGHKNLYVLPSDNLRATSAVTGQNLKAVTENLSYCEAVNAYLACQMEFEYAIYPHKGNWEEAGTYEEARRLNALAMTYQVMGGTKGTLPMEQGFLSVGDHNLQVSAFKKCEDRDSLILRVYNPTSQPIQAEISLTVPDVAVKEVITCNMNEERTEEVLAVENNCFTVNVGVNKIRTYELI